MLLKLSLLGIDHYYEMPNEEYFKRKPLQVMMFLRLEQGADVLDERYVQLEITSKRIELRR